jgi:hypothetical protein
MKQGPPFESELEKKEQCLDKSLKNLIVESKADSNITA